MKLTTFVVSGEEVNIPFAVSVGSPVQKVLIEIGKIKYWMEYSEYQKIVHWHAYEMPRKQ